MTTITIERTILDRLIEAWDSTVLPTHRDGMMQERMEDLRAELAKPVDITTEMAAVADRFAHKLALDLECVLADYSGTWYDTAMTTLGAYRKAMNAIHERESPTFMGEPVLLDIAAPTPAWHDAPEVAALIAKRDAQLAIYDEVIDNLQSQVDELVAALKGVIRVADRKTDEFDAARAAIAKAEGESA